MALFGIPEAAHFCRGYASTPGAANGSFRTLVNSFASGRSFTEGNADFDELRDCALREAERLLFLSISNYRRSFDLMVPSAASWAHVTMYYSTFFAASAILGMFGNWKLRKFPRIMDVSRSAPGTQQLSITTAPSSYSGSHQQFWDLFYARTASLLPWIDPTLRYAVQPVGNNVTWLIDARNTLNYDSFEACQSTRVFDSSFRRTRISTSLPGVLSTQFSIMEGLAVIAASFAKQFGLQTDALDGIHPAGSRSLKVRGLILDSKVPDLSRYVKRRAFVG